MNNKYNKAEMKNVAIGIVVVLAIVLLVIGFYFAFSGKSEKSSSETSNDMAGKKEFNVVSSSESFSEDKCEPGKMLILSNRKFFTRQESFNIAGKEEYEGEEFCILISNKGNQYYLSFDGNKMLEIKIENGERIITELKALP